MESSTSSAASLGQAPATEFIFSMGSLYSYLAKLTDRRKRRGVRYLLATVLVMIILAKLCGQDMPFGMADWAHHGGVCWSKF